MTLPTPDDLKKMDYAYLGQPFVYVPAKSSIDLTTMDYAYLGQPFVANPAASSPVGWTHEINSVANANIGEVNGVAKANIAQINGV